ncbi:MAG: hypothetical protein V2A78_13845 [bacterium]
MQIRFSKSPRRGLALVTTLMILFILAVIGFAICAIAVQNINLVSGYRNSSSAYYVARAGINEAFSRIDNDNSYGTSSAGSFTETLSNSESYTVNFVSGSFYSVNNLAGSGSVTDGSGDSLPKKFVSVISSATVRGRTVRLKAIGRLGYPGGDYAIFTDDTLSGANITGDVRNNYNGGGVGISLTTIMGTAMTMAAYGSISISNPGGSQVYGANRYPVPDLQVASTVLGAAGSNGVHVYTPATLPDPIDGATDPIIYVNGNVTAGGGGLTIRNGATLFINGSLTINGRLQLDTTATPSRNAIFCTGNFRANGSSGSDSCSILTGGTIRFNGSADLRGFMYCNGFFDQNGNSSYIGNIMVRNGGFSGGNTSVVYDPQYMENLGQFFPPGTARMRILTMGQI